MLLRGASALIGYPLGIITARLLGASELGALVYVMSWVGILVVPATMGFDRVIIRELAILNSKKNWEESKGLLLFSVRVSLLLSLLCIALSYFLVNKIIHFNNMDLYYIFILAIFSLPLMALNNLGCSILSGIGRVVFSQLPNILLNPIIMLLLIGFYVLFKGYEMNALNMIILNILTVIFIFLVIVFLVGKFLPKEMLLSKKIIYKKKKWLRSAFTFCILSGLYIINSRTDIIMLGMFKTNSDVGYYNVAARLSDVLTTVLLSVNGVIAPTISSLYSSGDRNKLQTFITKSSRLIFSLSLPIGIILFFFGSWILKLYGKDFVKGLVVLRILLIAQFVNFSCGSVGLILNMTGNERITAFGFGLSALLNIVLNILLIPQYGKEGAALATGFSIILWNFTLYIIIKKKLSLNPSVFSRIV